MSLFFFLLLSISFLSPASTSSPAIGVTFRPKISGLPSSDTVVSAIRSAGISHLLIYDPDPTTLRSFLYTDISLILHLPTSVSSAAASNSSAARRWLSDHVLPFHPRIKISAIALSIDHDDPSPNLFPAISNLRSSCSDLGLPSFLISAVHSFKILDPAFPPSAAKFQENLTESYIKPLLDFLSSTGSPFLIDLYPFDLYWTDHHVPIGFAMFEQALLSYRDDPGTGLRHRNLFDAMVDATFAAVAKAGHRRIPVVVTGTGWPSGGARAATVDYARKYNRGLVEHLRMGIGTPMQRDGAGAVYVRELFDDLASRGLEWGIWYRNLSAKYEMKFSGSASSGGVVTAAAVVSCSIWVLMLL